MDVRSDAVVLFGVTGDLVSKKLFPALYELTRRGRLPATVLGVARSPWDDQQLVTAARKAVTEAAGEVDEQAFEQLAARLTMISGDYADPATYERLAGALAEARRPLFYLAIPPAVFDAVVAGLAGSGLAERGRVVVEKPFGHDLRSSHELATTLSAAFAPERTFRIDHYLGKEPIEGLFALRFGNRVIEPLWSAEHIAGIQVTVAEKFGTQGRAGFYDKVGAIRDVLQNHVLQVVALLAMEAPADRTRQAFAEAEAEVLRQIKPLTPETTVRGQYAGYGDEPGVAPGSATETFVATRLTIGNKRWAGVPFFLRTGKLLPGTHTEVVVEFKPPRHDLLPGRQEPNLLRLRLGRGDGISVSLQVKRPGPGQATQTVELPVDFDDVLEPRREAYERLLDDAMDADHTRFARQAAIQQEWRIVDPILDRTDGVQPYEPGSWGPDAAQQLVTWHNPA
ncbi:glucose-6-phosphate dehydrogenase [Actinoplanes sp. N902-109]|uniref:glucose-6-phosphate dehydrogenase n=1 Tax=Actinoplanes sp. (strain N902-109) TaxID=649831 RepID=UPI0003293D55|nr:glucose-6-phosphate dehydrogenase [Actinoplanes sp. N902-109]AGL17305.1 glucose-6-phosphate 1-dehydrogenase [Actinoplanes sp. N902-109]